MKILYIGCVKSSYVFLNALLENKADIVGVITKESSAFNSDFTDITPLCREHHIPFIYVSDINSHETIQLIEASHPDIGFCFGWSQLVKGYIIDLFPKGMIGYHPAALPDNRGRHPIIWALALGLDKTASSFFMMETTPDSGDILSQVEIAIQYEDTADTLMRKLLDAGAKQIVTLWQELEHDAIHPVSQKNHIGNSWRKRGKPDGQIDWRMSSKAIYDLVRALTKPYVGAHFMKDGIEIKVWRVREVKSNAYQNIEPGKVVAVCQNSFLVKTGDHLIEVLECDPIDISVGEYL